MRRATLHWSGGRCKRSGKINGAFFWCLAGRLPALDGYDSVCEFITVETPAIKVLGQLHKTPWQRFVRLQRTAAQLTKGRGQPKGVFRFASNEACDAWTENLNRQGK